MSKVKSFAWVLLWTFVFYAFQVVVGLPIILAAGGSKDSTEPRPIEHLALAFAALVTVGVLLIVQRRRKPAVDPASDFRWVPIATFALLALAGVLLQVGESSVSALIDRPGAPREANAEFFVQFLSAAVAVPLVEEFIFRGLISRELRRWMTPTKALIVQAVLFSVYHGEFDPLRLLGLFLFGILYGYVALSYRSVIASTVVHGVSNLTVSGLEVLDLRQTSRSVFIALALAAVVGAGFLVFLVRRNGERYRLRRSLTELV